jgi:hypothetical protein
MPERVALFTMSPSSGATTQQTRAPAESTVYLLLSRIDEAVAASTAFTAEAAQPR